MQSLNSTTSLSPLFHDPTNDLKIITEGGNYHLK